MRVKIISFFYAIPIIHALASVTTNYFDASSLNPGFFRVAILFMLLMLFAVRYRFPSQSFTTLIFLFIIYNFILVVINENTANTLINYLRLSLPLLLFFVGYKVIKCQAKLNSLFKAYMVALTILCLNYIIANILGLGTTTYDDDSFYTGGAGPGLTNELAIHILIAMIVPSLGIYQPKKQKIYNTLLVVLSIVFVLIALRRGAYLTLGVGVVTLFFLTKQKIRQAKNYISIVVIMVLLYPLYGNLLMSRYETRAESRGGSILNYQVEGRYNEIGLVYQDIKNADLNRLLFGTHNLNSIKYFSDSYNIPRSLHVGYIAILHGSGVVGLILFFGLLCSIIKEERSLYKLHKKDNYYKQLHALFYALITGLLAFLITSRLHGFSVTTTVFFLLGSILGVMRHNISNKVFQQ